MFKTKTTFPAGKVVDESLYFFRNSEPGKRLFGLRFAYEAGVSEDGTFAAGGFADD